MAGGSQWLKSTTPGWIFTLLLYPPTASLYVMVMIFIINWLLIFIIIGSTRPSRNNRSLFAMASSGSGSRKRKHCECGFELTGLSNYHQDEHKRSKRHCRYLDSSSCLRMESFFHKIAALSSSTADSAIPITTEECDAVIHLPLLSRHPLSAM